MTLSQLSGRARGSSCSLQQWQVAWMHTQNTSRQSRTSLPCCQTVPKRPSSFQQSASLQCEARQAECEKQESQWKPRQVTESKSGRLSWRFRKYRISLFLCAVAPFFPFDRLPVLALPNRTPSEVCVPQGDIVVRHSQQVIPPEDSRTPRPVKHSTQTTWGETPEEDGQQKPIHVDDWFAPAHNLQLSRLPAKADYQEYLAQRSSPSTAPAVALLGRSSAERNRNKVDDVVLPSCKEESGPGMGQGAATVKTNGGEVLRAGLAVSIASSPSVGAAHEERNPPVAALPCDATVVSTSDAGAADATMFDVLPKSVVAESAAASARDNTGVILNVPPLTPPGRGLPAEMSSNAQFRSRLPLEFSKPEWDRRTSLDLKRLFTTLAEGRNEAASSDREATEDRSSTYGEMGSGAPAQTQQRGENAEKEEVWMSVSDAMVPIAAAILEAAEVAAPHLLKRVQNASERASASTSPKNNSYRAGHSPGVKETAAVAQLRDSLTKTLRAALLKRVPGVHPLLLSMVTLASYPQLLPTGYDSARERDRRPTSCVNMLSSSVGDAATVDEAKSKSAAVARSAMSTRLQMDETMHSDAKSDGKRIPTSQDSTGETKKDNRTSNAGSERSRSDTHEEVCLRSVVRRSIDAPLPLSRQLKLLQDLRMPHWAPNVTRESTTKETDNITKTAFRALKMSPSRYFRELYISEKKLEERWVRELRPSYDGGKVVKLRASYAKAPAAFKRTCPTVKSVRGGPTACASLRAAQDAMELANEDSEPVTENVDEFVERMVENSSLKGGRLGRTVRAPRSDAAAADELAPVDQLHSLEPHQALEIKELLSSLGIELGVRNVEGRVEGREEASLFTPFSGRPDEEYEYSQRGPAELTPDPRVRVVNQGTGRILASAGRSRDTMDTVTEVIDMTELGEVAFFNIEAFLRQQTCGNLYSTLLLDSKHSRPPVECVVRALAGHATKVAQRTSVTTGSLLVKIFTRIFRTFKEDEIALDLLRSAQLAIAKWARRADSTGSTSAVNPGNLLNLALKSRPESIPFFVTLVTSLVVCQASLPYNMRPLLGYPVIPLAFRVPLPAMQYLHRVGAFIELPPTAPSEFPLELHNIALQQTMHARLQPWKRRLYNGLFIIWNLVYHMYHLGERPADFSSQSVDAVFPWPWRVTHVGSCLWSERVPVRNCDGTVNPGPQDEVDTSALTVHKDTRASPTKEPFAQKGAAALPPHTRPEGTLPAASPDTCGPDATHKVVVESPILARLDLRPEAAERRFTLQDTDFRKATQRLAQGENTRQKKSGLPDAPEVVTDSTAEVETCWLFKGTDSPKQWNLNAQLGTRHDATFSPKARVHTGFSTHFHNSVRGAMERFIQESLEKGRERTSHSPYVILFAGHSLGGALAQLAAWYAAIHLQRLIQDGKVLIFCVSFGAPSVGDKHAYSEMSKLGIRFFRLKSDTDPVPVLIQDVNLSSLHSSDDSTLIIRSSEFTRIALRDPHNRLYFHGLLWSEDSLQPLRLQKWLLRLAASPMNLHSLVDVRLHPMNSHMYIYACTLTLLAGAFRAADWSSMCAAPLMTRWPLMPLPASPEMELEMRRAHGELPGRLATLEETRGNIQRNVAHRGSSKLVVQA